MMPEFKCVVRAASAAVLVLALASLAQAQRGRPGPGQRTTREPEPQTELERELTIRALEEQLRKPEARREQRLAFARISEDFTRIQVVNNDVLAHAASRDGALDLEFVAKSAAEIKKLAVRLRDNLVLPEPEKGYKRSHAEVGPDKEQLKASLAALGKLVAGFAHNPIFKEVNVVDAQLSAKARRDLEEIITLSDQVRKACEKLGKTQRSDE